MKIQDLKFNSLVSYEKRPITLERIDPTDIWGRYGGDLNNKVCRPELADLRGIPLTEKILLDSGFSYYENIAKFYHNDSCSISFVNGKVSRFEACTERGTIIMKDMEYVHNLQNAFYFATGHELEITIK